MEIISVDTPYGEIKVIKNHDDSYEVYVDGVSKHGKCTQEDVFRALASYMTSICFKIEMLEDRLYNYERRM